MNIRKLCKICGKPPKKNHFCLTLEDKLEILLVCEWERHGQKTKYKAWLKKMNIYSNKMMSK